MRDHDEGEAAGARRGRPAPGAGRAEREARLAERLRANLQRRKQQARQRAAGAPGALGAPDAEEPSDGNP
ncbi:hypothetical protein SAMN06265365_15017 [Tistlia consotensis]|uniref:Uncharacterized protein n=1 Tax=Tistlia consotensis USBA 355 TaxID=560819 RepID=A0A1Y6CRN8_9PROT|nr:hypothetical protein [Tistlia consotensis]SMF83538.1 hypothetical protein SAMN05428998_15016 [Tistlia consotensis USBA 355]SNS33650.1 hypothetical protein SAMN06265365_15017 [Tistlia consotensis]